MFLLLLFFERLNVWTGADNVYGNILFHKDSEIHEPEAHPPEQILCRKNEARILNAGPLATLTKRDMQLSTAKQQSPESNSL